MFHLEPKPFSLNKIIIALLFVVWLACYNNKRHILKERMIKILYKSFINIVYQEADAVSMKYKN